MVVWSKDDDGNIIYYNFTKDRWEYPDKIGTVSIHGKHRKLCSKCHMPSVDLNGVKDCDFCLQSLTTCDFIEYACCGHGDDSQAYIALKDGRRFILDKDYE